MHRFQMRIVVTLPVQIVELMPELPVQTDNIVIKIPGCVRYRGMGVPDLVIRIILNLMESNVEFFEDSDAEF